MLNRLALNTSTLQADGLEAKIAATASAGFSGIEIWSEEIDGWVAAGGSMNELRRRIEDAGLAPVNLIGFFYWAGDDRDKRADGMAEAMRCFDAAAAIGCPFVAAPPVGAVKEAVDLRAVSERFAELADLGRAAGASPLVEYWGVSRTLGTLGEALQVAADCGRTGARVLADVFHTYKGTGHFDGFALLGDRSLGLLHLNDYPASGDRATARDADRVLPGEGAAPLGEILGGLRAAGYSGFLSVELFNQALWAMGPQRAAEASMAAVRRTLEALEQ